MPNLHYGMGFGLVWASTFCADNGHSARDGAFPNFESTGHCISERGTNCTEWRRQIINTTNTGYISGISFDNPEYRALRYTIHNTENRDRVVRTGLAAEARMQSGERLVQHWTPPKFYCHHSHRLQLRLLLAPVPQSQFIVHTLLGDHYR